MRNVLYIILLFVLLLLTGCDESFDPKTDFEEQYVLSSVIAGNVQTQPVSVDAYLTKMYDVEGTNPYTNEEDPAVKGATVQVLVRDNAYDLIETEIPEGNPRYNSDMVLYRGTFTSPRANDQVILRAVLPNGKVLTSTIQFPASLHFSINYPYVRGYTSDIDQGYFGNALRFSWDGLLEELYFPDLIITYQQYENDTWVTKRAEVPTRIVGDEYIYPDYIYDFEISYPFDVIDQAVADLGKDVEDKSHIKLTGLDFNLVSFERNLANYYSSTNGFLDSYSIRLDQEVYSNVSGGLGIFGASLKFDYELGFDYGYTDSFGYSR